MSSAFGAPAIVNQPDDLSAPAPTPVDPLYLFLTWTNTNPDKPMPGDKLDAEFQHAYDAINLLIERLAMIQADDGTLPVVMRLGDLLVAKGLITADEWNGVLNG